jgi:hypothetical protein
MNIFAIHIDPDIAAIEHTDKHVVKMITENVQMMSAAVRMSGIDVGYRLTHKNHPCTIWTRESLSNWIWLKRLTIALHKEWQFRFNHPSDHHHKAYDMMLTLPNPNIKDIGLTPFALAIPEKFKKPDPVESYRHFYAVDKRHLHKWTGRSNPNWINQYLTEDIT